MKKLLFIIIVLLVSFNSYSQNKFKLVKGFSKIKHFSPRTLEVHRTSIVDVKQVQIALRAVQKESEYRKLLIKPHAQEFVDLQKRDIFLIRSVYSQRICEPNEIYGSYNYLRIYTNSLNNNRKKLIRDVSSYNGIHHIISLNVIEAIYKEAYKNTDKEILHPTLQEIKANAPAILHPLHNNPQFSYIFHDFERQLEIYNSKGIKGILIEFFSAITIANTILGLPQIPESVIEGTMLEAEFWARYSGFVWSTEEVNLK